MKLRDLYDASGRLMPDPQDLKNELIRLFHVAKAEPYILKFIADNVRHNKDKNPSSDVAIGIRELAQIWHKAHRNDIPV